MSSQSNLMPRLRRAAVERLLSRVTDLSQDELEHGLHELQVYQEELLLQHESLLETQGELERQLARSRALFDEAPVGYLVIDGGGRIQQVNHVAAESLGLVRAAVNNSYLASHFSNSSRHEFLGCLSALRNGAAVATAEVRLSTDLVWKLDVKPFADHPGAENVFLVSASDITALRQSEIDLQLARQEAERANYLKERFLANMSHEVRTPLTLIIGFVETLMEMDFDAEVVRRLGIMQRAGKNLLGVLNDVVDFAKIEADHLQIERAAFAPKEIVLHVCDLFADVAREREVSLIVAVDEDASLPSSALGDEMRLNQILVNLVSNALKFTPSGGSVVVSAAYRAGNLVVSVKDSGSGISESFLPHLFEPFRQDQHRDTRTRGGAGLGLSISRRIAVLMGGDLLAHNSSEGGAVFTLQLPLPENRARNAVIEDRSTSKISMYEAPEGEEPRLLVVDDDPDIVDLVSVVLESMGYAYDTAENGLEALERIEERAYGVVLMDMQMPVMTGLEALTKLRESNRHRDAFVVALTARAVRDDEESLLGAGFDAYVAKPIAFDELEAIITQRLGRPDLAFEAESE